MRLLFGLIMALSEDEFARLSTLRLKGKQLAVMTMMFNARKNGEPPTDEAVANINTTSTHLYEMCSVLLARSLEFLVPQGGVAILEFVANKNLKIAFKQELLKQTQRIDPQNQKAKEDFYLSAFELIFRQTYSVVDFDLGVKYGDLYIHSKRNYSIEDKMAVEARKTIHQLVGSLADSRRYLKDSEELGNQLKGYESAVRNSTHPYFCYTVYSGLAWYSQHVLGKPDMNLRYLQRATVFAEKLDNYVFRELEVEMKLRIADAQFALGATEEALEIYERAFRMARPDSLLWKRNYFLLRYLDILIYHGKYFQAEEILKKYYEPMLRLAPSTTSATASCLFAILYLLSGKYDESKKYLDTAFKLNRRTNYTAYNDIRNRIVRAALSYITGDWDETDHTTRTTMTYLYSRDLGLSRHSVGYYFKIIDALIILFKEGKPLSRKNETKFIELTHPKEGLMGLILKKVRATNAKPQAKAKS
ncbi:MAG: hypothetical protein WCH46_03190 [bacterium]